MIIAAEIANALVKSSVLGTAREVRDQLQHEHDESTLVARAQGVLMAVQDCSMAQASDLIRQAASDNSEPIIATAERILASVRPDRSSTDLDRLDRPNRLDLDDSASTTDQAT